MSEPRRVDQLPWWPAVVAVAAGAALIALGRALVRYVDDAIDKVDYA